MTAVEQLSLERTAAAKAPTSPSATFVGPDERGIGRILIDRSDDRVNAIDARMILDLGSAVAQARATELRGLLLTSGKPGQFIAGADLEMIGHASADELAMAVGELQKVLDDLASLPCATVAVISASALGGAYEVALACDWRVAADLPSLRIGFPEVRFGLFPGAGGTQRLPRLVGLPRALELILTSRALSPRAALRAGLVDEVVQPALGERAAGDRAIRSGKRRPSGGTRLVERAITWIPPLRAVALAQARRSAIGETRGRYPAPLRAIEAIGIGLAEEGAAGKAKVARAFGELGAGTVGRNLVGLALLGLHQRGGARAGLPRPRAIGQLGVVGSGFMGSGIAQAAALAGMRVRVRDVDTAAVARGLANVRRLTQDAMRKRVVERRDGARAIGRVSGAPDYSGFRTADLVIEAVFEDLATKRRVIAELEEHLRDDTVIASNTSALPIAEIAGAARRHERIVGMHFFSPVHRMQLVEIVRPAAASDAAVADAVGAAQALGETAIVVRDGAGFYTTRVMSAMHAEAFVLLVQGARIEEVDAAMKAFGWPIGPFALLDEVGLDVARHAGETVWRARGVAPPVIVGQLVTDGLKGKRGGAGFYLYQGKGRVPNPRVHELVGATPGTLREDVAERLTLAFVNEAARCLDDETLRSPAEGDLGAVLGLGFPPFLGGPFRWADTRGPELRDALERLAERFGDRFAMARSLRDGSRFFAS